MSETTAFPESEGAMTPTSPPSSDGPAGAQAPSGKAYDAAYDAFVKRTGDHDMDTGILAALRAAYAVDFPADGPAGELEPEEMEKLATRAQLAYWDAAAGSDRWMAVVYAMLDAAALPSRADEPAPEREREWAHLAAKEALMRYGLYLSTPAMTCDVIVNAVLDAAALRAPAPEADRASGEKRQV